MALSLAVMAGCDPADPTPSPSPKPEPEPDPTPAIQSFEVAVDAVTKTSVTYTVTPALLDKEYLAVVKTAESIKGLDDEDIVNLVFPLGNGFTTTVEGQQSVLLVGGGVGIAGCL